MITLYSGTPGSGKSYHAAATAYSQLKRKRWVISNCGYNTASPYYKDLEIADVSPTRLLSLADDIRADKGVDRLPEGSLLLILDEAQLIFNARSWQANDNKGWLSFFSQHRKYGYDVIMIAQSDRMIDRQIRSLIEYQIIHRRVGRFGVWGKILGFLLGNFVAVKTWYGIREKIGSDWIRYHRKIAKMYDTYQIYDPK